MSALNQSNLVANLAATTDQNTIRTMLGSAVWQMFDNYVDLHRDDKLVTIKKFGIGFSVTVGMVEPALRLVFVGIFGPDPKR